MVLSMPLTGKDGNNYWIRSWFKIKCGWNRPGEYTYAQLVDIKTYKGKTQYVWSSIDGFQFVSYDLKDTIRVTRKEVII